MFASLLYKTKLIKDTSLPKGRNLPFYLLQQNNIEYLKQDFLQENIKFDVTETFLKTLLPRQKKKDKDKICIFYSSRSFPSWLSPEIFKPQQ